MPGAMQPAKHQRSRPPAETRSLPISFACCAASMCTFLSPTHLKKEKQIKILLWGFYEEQTNKQTSTPGVMQPVRHRVPRPLRGIGPPDNSHILLVHFHLPFTHVLPFATFSFSFREIRVRYSICVNRLCKGGPLGDREREKEKVSHTGARSWEMVPADTYLSITLFQ